MPSQFFNNRLLVSPQVEVAVNDSELQPATSSTSINVAILGMSTTGVPGVPTAVQSVDQAIAAFGAGSLVEGIVRAFNPTPGGAGAQTVYGVRVNIATPSSFALQDSVPANAITVYSSGYGAYTASTSVQVTAASTPGTGAIPLGAIKITTAQPGSPTVSQDNLGYSALTVQYGAVINSTLGASYASGVTSLNIGASLSITTPAKLLINDPVNPEIVSISAYATPTATVGATQFAHASGVPLVIYNGLSGVVASVGGWTAQVTTTAGAQGGNSCGLGVFGANCTAYNLPVGAQLLIGQGSNQETVTVTATTPGATPPLVTISGQGANGGFVYNHAVNDKIASASPLLLLNATATADQVGFVLAGYSTLQALATAASLVTTGNWTVAVPAAMNQTPGALNQVGPGSSPSILDVGTSVTISYTGSVNNTGGLQTLTGIAQAVTDWLNGKASPYCTATVPGGTASGRAAYAVNATTGVPAGGRVPSTSAAVGGTNPALLSGGTDGIASGSITGLTALAAQASWQAAFTALQGVDTPLFVCMTDNAAIHALGDAHAAYMSSAGKMERIQICGGALGESTSQAVARAAALNSYRTAIAYPGIQDYDLSGNLAARPPYYTAALLAGAAAGMGEPQALTNQLLRISGLEVRAAGTAGNLGPYTQLDYDNLVSGNVIGIQYKPGRGYVIVQSIMTWAGDSLYTKHEMSTRRITDRIVRALREKFTLDLGRNVGPALLNQIMADGQGVLSQYARLGYLVGDSQNPPFKGLSVAVQQGRPDTVTFSAQVSPAVPCNYILATVHATAYGTAPTS